MVSLWSTRRRNVRVANILALNTLIHVYAYALLYLQFSFWPALPTATDPELPSASRLVALVNGKGNLNYDIVPSLCLSRIRIRTRVRNYQRNITLIAISNYVKFSWA